MNAQETEPVKVRFRSTGAVGVVDRDLGDRLDVLFDGDSDTGGRSHVIRCRRDQLEFIEVLEVGHLVVGIEVDDRDGAPGVVTGWVSRLLPDDTVEIMTRSGGWVIVRDAERLADVDPTYDYQRRRAAELLRELAVEYISANRWLNVAEVNEALDSGRDGETPYPTTSRHTGRLGMTGPRYDRVTDGITGSWFEPAPPAQQYGFRQTAWIAERAAERLAAMQPTVEEPF